MKHVQHTASGDWKLEFARGKHEKCVCVKSTTACCDAGVEDVVMTTVPNDL